MRSLFFLVAVVVPFVALSGIDGKYKAFSDVKDLRNEIKATDTRNVSVVGDVQSIEHKKHFVLESGGIINDSILVITPKSLDNLAGSLKQDQKVKVYGEVYITQQREIVRKEDWQLDPHVEAEMKRRKMFLLAEKIEVDPK